MNGVVFLYHIKQMRDMLAIAKFYVNDGAGGR